MLTSGNNSLFSSQPAISSGGQLTYTPAADKNGSTTVTVRDDNGMPDDSSDDVQSATQSFTVTVNAVNEDGTLTVPGVLGNNAIFAVDGELDSISCGPGEGDVAFVDQADLDAEGTDMQDFVRLTSCGEIVEPSVEQPPVETVSIR